MTLRRGLVAVLAALVVATGARATDAAEASAVATASAFAGRWTLDPARSQFGAVGPPQTMVVEIEPDGAEIRYRSTTVRADGRQSEVRFVAVVDGELAMVEGSKGLLAPVQLRRLDAGTIEARYVRELRIVATSRWHLGEDGRALTVSTESEDSDGVRGTIVMVFRRAAPGG